MMGAYFAVAAYGATDSFVIAAIAAVLGALLLGLLLERSILAKLYARDHLYQVLATFGVILVLKEFARVVWGQSPIFLDVGSRCTI